MTSQSWRIAPAPDPTAPTIPQTITAAGRLLQGEQAGNKLSRLIVAASQRSTATFPRRAA